MFYIQAYDYMSKQSRLDINIFLLFWTFQYVDLKAL
jgi:hypothetical protein